MNGVSDKLRFGVSYCPYAKSGDLDMSLWERDIRTMKELNFNTVRCFVAWDRIETEEGKFDFSKTDYLFELAEKHEMDVILNVGGVFACYGGIYPPPWLIRDYKCQTVVENPSVLEKSFGPFRRLCLDDALYRSKAENFTVGMITRYAGNQRLFAWNVWNEAFLKPICYCPLTIAKFREWLKTKYKNDLEKLNEIWGTEFPVNYKIWDEVEPGLGAGFLSNGYVARTDWLKFNQERVASWINGVNALLRQHDHGKHPTTSNIVITSVLGNGADHGHPDIWSQSHDLDITGFSYYTMLSSPSQLSSGLAMVRGSSNDKKGFWILETEAGQIANREKYPNEIAYGPRREATHWLSVLHGAKMILLWKFGGRVTDGQTDCFNLCAWDGTITERAKLNAKVAKDFLDNEELFLNKSYKAETAILSSTDNKIFQQVGGGDFLDWEKSRYGAWRILRDLHVAGDFISDIQVMEGKLSKYKALIIPHTTSMNAELAAKIMDFARNGGAIIADMKLAVHDENGRIFPQAPGHGLKEIFGAFCNDYLLGAPEFPIKVKGSAGTIISSSYFHSNLIVENGTEILANYSDGATAICKREKCLYFGTLAFKDYEEKPSREILELVKTALAEVGVESDYEVSDAEFEDLEIGALTGDDGSRVHFFLNLGSKDLSIKLKIKSLKKNVLRDLLGKKDCNIKNGVLNLAIPAWSAKIFF